MQFKSGRGKRVHAVGVPALVTAVLLGGAAGGIRQSSRTLLPTGKEIQPQGTQTEVGSFPVNMALSPDGRWLVVTNTGFRETLSVLSAADGRLISQIPFNTPLTPGGRAQTALYVGLAFAPSGDSTPPARSLLYVSRGPENKVSIFTLNAQGKLEDTGQALATHTDTAASPDFIAGLALSSDGSRCYVVNNQTSQATDFKGSVSILDVANHRTLGRVLTPGFPYAIAAVTKGVHADKKVYVSSERDGVVSVLDVSDPANGKVVRDIKTGDHPIALLLDSVQQRLFVANAGSDTVSLLDTNTDKVTQTLSLRMGKIKNLPGATPTGLALSPDESRLYVSLGDMNAVAVLNVTGRGMKLAGAIPVGWYPTSVAVSRDGARLFVANAKGVRSRNPNKLDSGPKGVWGQYIENILEGTVACIPMPDASTLPRLTAMALAANAPDNAPAPPRPPIKHVLYIIKENRTYDEVLGDLPQGNGDPSLVLFGRSVTPNLHALAERFVLLDNFYDCAEVSADGWNWSTSGMTGEYAARNVHFNYSGRGRSYDFEGENNGTPVDLLNLPDVNRAPGGYIWDAVAKKGLPYRSYGFFTAFADATDANSKVIVRENAPTRKALVGHADVDFLKFDMDYADSDAWQLHNCPESVKKQTYGQHNAPSRFAEWKREFDGFLQDGSLPAFLMVRLPRDHTAGTRPGSASPRAMIADNDYGVGQIVEAVSASPYWKDTAIFILEDDAQDGYDHVDAHRSLCFVISPYIRRGAVDHHFYNTDSVLRSMEWLLGVPPMCQYDARAPLIAAWGTGGDNNAPYKAMLPARNIIAEVNTATAYRAKESRRLDFTCADRIPDGILQDIIWHSVRGARSPVPKSHSIQRLSVVSSDADDR